MPQVKSLRHQHLLLEEHKGHPGVVLKGRTSSCNEAQIRVKKRCLGDLRAAGEMEPVRYTTWHSQAIPKLLECQKKGEQESPEIHQNMNGIHRRQICSQRAQPPPSRLEATYTLGMQQWDGIAQRHGDGFVASVGWLMKKEGEPGVLR